MMTEILILHPELTPGADDDICVFTLEDSLVADVTATRFDIQARS